MSHEDGSCLKNFNPFRHSLNALCLIFGMGREDPAAALKEIGGTLGKSPTLFACHRMRAQELELVLGQALKSGDDRFFNTADINDEQLFVRRASLSNLYCQARQCRKGSGKDDEITPLDQFLPCFK